MRIWFVISLVWVAFAVRVFGQIDNEFWFAAPDITSEYGQAPKNGAPISLHFTALYATTVTVSRPADPTFMPIQITLQDLEHKSIVLNDIIPINQIETYPRALTDPTAIQDKGFKITAYPGEICCYYELDNKLNKDIFALKGTNGLGQEFFVSTQDAFNNGDYKGTAWSGFVIVATEDNTQVDIELNDDLLHFNPHPANVSITLDAGQTYAFRSLYTDPDRHINGVHVTSDKNIAITAYDDAMQKERDVGGTSWDAFGDQLVPIDIIGNEYIIMKGFIVDAPEDGGERIFITATEDNTEIYIDNNPVPIAIINKGEVYSYDIVNQATLVTTSKNVYINHITGFEADLGGAILPPIGNCSGSYDVAFNRSPDPSESFYLNIMVKNITTPGHPLRNQAVKNFSIVSNGVTTPIPESYFTYILDSTYAVLKRDPAVVAFITSCIEPGWAAMVRNPVTVFHLGVINGHINTGCKYGYFSDYKTINTSAGIGGALSNTREVYCDLDPIRLVARGGLTYEWTCTSDPSVTSLISDPTLADPFFMPETSGNYMFNVKITQSCGPEVNLPLQIIVMYRPVANFEIDAQEACSPFTATITHLVDMSKVGRMEWYFDYPNAEPVAKQDTLGNPFTYTFPENNTDSVVSYDIRLITWAPFNTCPDEMERTVLIKPGVNADFTVSDSIGCHPLPVTFNNTSTGHLTSSSYYWEFGDNLQSYDSLPVHNYMNFSNLTKTFHAKLVVTSPFDCKDSVMRDIDVHPYIRGSLAVDSAVRCSPIVSRLNPASSIGVDTFLYTIHYPDSTQYIRSLSYEGITIAYSDTTYQNGPDTLLAGLVVQNRMGCTDTVPVKEIVVYPEVMTSFDLSPTEICDGAQIQIENQSRGDNLIFIWDFGDGSSAQDTVLRTLQHTYYNPGDVNKEFTVSLEGINEYLCAKSFDTLITVFPRVNAFFTLESLNNCSPLDMQINNLSHRVDQYEWDFGDGSPLDLSADPVLYHQYVNPLPDRDTTFTLALKTVSPEGCLDSMSRSIYLLPQVVADFSISESAACSPSSIHFENLSTGKDLLFTWEFGELVKTNNNMAFNETFTNYGAVDSTFDIILTATNPQVCESTMIRQFTAFPYVNAAFGVDNMTGCSPVVVSTSNYSSPGSKFFDWDFGEGHTSTAFEPANEYINSSFVMRKDTLQLIAKNDHACYDTATRVITVYPEIIADFQTSEASGCQPLEIAFINQTNIIPNTTFFWDFNDGTYSTSAVPAAHMFTNSESTSVLKEIQLTVVSQYGCTDTVVRQVEVYPEILAYFLLDRPSICSSDSFLVDRTGSRGAIAEYLWDFNGDGTTDDQRADNLFTYTYVNHTSLSDTFDIQLTVKNIQGCEHSISRSILVHPAVVSNFTVDENVACYPHTTLFQNASESKGTVATKFNWDFGDGTYSNELNDQVEHNYWNFTPDISRQFTVTLEAESDHHCTDIHSEMVTIHPKPAADFSFPISSDCPPFTVPFANLSEGVDLTYQWDFDNGNFSTLVDPTEVFDNTGTSVIQRNIMLIATTAFNCSDTVIKPVSVFPGVGVDFETSVLAGCSPLQVDFDGTTFNEAINEWFVDGIIFSTEADPTYSFENESANTRDFNITFRATSAYNCTAETTKQITVYASPQAEFVPSPVSQDFNTILDHTPVTFNNITQFQGSSNWTYQWDFGDGTTGQNSSQLFTRNYSIWGDIHDNDRIPVTLHVWNIGMSECRDSIMHDIYIHPPLPQVYIGEDILGCMPMTVDFTSTTKYNYPDGYEWDFGYEGMTSTDPNPQSVTFDTAGVYIVTLTVNGDGGENRDFRKITVNPRPVADFSFTPDYVWVRSQTEAGTPIKFFNTTQMGSTYRWDFDDGEISTEYQPQHEYMQIGEYYVTLIVGSEGGCYDTLTHEIPIIVDGRGSLAFPNAITIYPDDPADEYYDPGEADPRIFRPVAEGVEEYRLEIYNRWGELLFVSEDVNRGWNGFIKGSPATQDVYVWRVTATFSNGRPFVKAGDVTLLIRKPGF